MTPQISNFHWTLIKWLQTENHLHHKSLQLKKQQIQGYTETETPPRKASKHILTITDKEPKKHLMDWTFKPCRASDTNRLSTRQPTVAWERERERSCRSEAYRSQSHVTPTQERLYEALCNLRKTLLCDPGPKNTTTRVWNQQKSL